MKKFYTLLLLAVATVFSAGAAKSVPYGPEKLATPGDAVSDAAWTRHNADGGLSWTAVPSGAVLKVNGEDLGGVRIWSNAATTVDDWLISPKIALEAGKKYEVKYHYYVWNAAETSIANLDVQLSTTSPITDAATAKEATVIKKYENLDRTKAPTAWAEESIVVTPEAAGEYYVTFHVYGDYTKCVCLSGLTVTEIDKDPDKPVNPDDPVVGKDVPYSSPVALKANTFDDGWSFIDANADSRTWSVYSDSQTTSWGGTGYAARSYYHSTNQADDWLISPAIHLEAGKEYKAFYIFKTYSDPQSMDVYCSKSKVPAEITTTTPLKTYEKITQRNYSREVITIVPEETGEYYISFHERSDKNKYYVYIACFEICENVFIPSGVSDLTAERDPMRGLKVSLNWTLPTTSTFGDAFTPEQTIEAVNIYRDGGERPVAILEGTATSFTDSDEYGLEAGTHTYAVEVVVAGVKSAKVNVGPTKYVGPVAPVAIPATMAINSADAFDNWTVVKDAASQNTNNWVFYSSYARFQVVNSRAESDWLISPPVTVAEPGYYKITVNASKSTSYDYTHKLEVRYGKGMTAEALSNVACDAIPLTNRAADYSYTVRIDEAGAYNFAVYASNPAPTSSMQLSVYSIKVEKTEKTPAAVSGLTATPDADEALKVVLDWTAPALATSGDALAADEYTVEIARGTDVIATLPGGSTTYTDETIEKSGIYTYTVTTLAPEGSHVEGVSVTTSWVGPRVVELPYTTGFSTADATRQIWEVLDGNADGKSWNYENQTYVCDEPASETDGVYAYDDYLLSPYFELAPGYYSVDFRTRGGYSYGNLNLAMNVGVIAAGTALPGRVALEQPKQYIINSSSTWTAMDTYVFHVEEAGRYQVVFAANEPNSKVTQTSYRMAVDDVKVAAYPVLPGVVTDLVVTPAADEALEAVITWTNPTTTNVEGLAPVLVRADVYRGETMIGSVEEGLVAGAQSSFTDNTLELPGRYTYKVEVFTEGGKSASAAPAVESEWIGGGLPTPYEVSGATFGAWTLIDVDGDKSTWGDNAWSVNNTALKADVTTKADDWAISPRINIDYFSIYNLSLETFLGVSYDKYGPYELDIYAGQSADPAEFGLIATISVATGLNSSNTQRDEILVYGSRLFGEPAALSDDPSAIAVKVPCGATSFALHARQTGGVNVKSFKVEYHGIFTGIESVELGEGISFDGTALRFDGMATDVCVYDVAGKLAAAQAAADGSVSLEGLASGVYLVRLTLDGQVKTVKVVK